MKSSQGIPWHHECWIVRLNEATTEQQVKSRERKNSSSNSILTQPHISVSVASKKHQHWSFCRYDSATCICVADLDLSGRQKLLLGTYGQVTFNQFIFCQSRKIDVYFKELLVYSQTEEQKWELEWQRSLPAPILSLCQVFIILFDLILFFILFSQATYFVFKFNCVQLLPSPCLSLH